MCRPPPSHKKIDKSKKINKKNKIKKNIESGKAAKRTKGAIAIFSHRSRIYVSTCHTISSFSNFLFFRSVHIFQMSNSCRGYRKQMLHIWLSCETLHLKWASNKLLGLMPQIRSTLWTCSGRRIKRANGGMCGELRLTPESLTNHFSQIWLKKTTTKKPYDHTCRF